LELASLKVNDSSAFKRGLVTHIDCVEVEMATCEWLFCFVMLVLNILVVSWINTVNILHIFRFEKDKPFVSQI